jgi:hypothetical protein
MKGDACSIETADVRARFGFEPNGDVDIFAHRFRPLRVAQAPHSTTRLMSLLNYSR